MSAGQESADRAMDRVRSELGNEIANHVLDVNDRKNRAVQIVREMLEDESSFLYEQGRQDILRQTMEDGSSLYCTSCGGVVPSARWQQHQSFWCEANIHDKREECVMDDS